MTSMRDQLTPYTDAGRPPYVAALVVALGALILYIVTLAPTTQFWDASEYITAVHAFGIPHPPGNPLFILLAHAWGQLPLGADYARRINLLATVTSAAAAGLWFLIGERWLRPIVSHTGVRRLTAAAGVMVGATAFTVWNQSVANEKVYTVSVLSIALVLWLVVRWGDQPSEGRRDHHLVLIVYLLALTATNHLMGVLVAPAVLVYVLATDPRALRRPRFLVAAALVAAVGTSVYLFLPIRAHFDPYLNEGAPTTWRALKAVLTREQFGKPSVFDNPMYLTGPDNPGRTLVLYAQQLLNYVQYFTWQFGRDWWPGVQRAFAVVFAALGPALRAPVAPGAKQAERGEPDREGALHAGPPVAAELPREVLHVVQELLRVEDQRAPGIVRAGQVHRVVEHGRLAELLAGQHGLERPPRRRRAFVQVRIKVRPDREKKVDARPHRRHERRGDEEAGAAQRGRIGGKDVDEHRRGDEHAHQMVRRRERQEIHDEDEVVIAPRLRGGSLVGPAHDEPQHECDRQHAHRVDLLVHHRLVPHGEPSGGDQRPGRGREPPCPGGGGRRHDGAQPALADEEPEAGRRGARDGGEQVDAPGVVGPERQQSPRVAEDDEQGVPRRMRDPERVGRGHVLGAVPELRRGRDGRDVEEQGAERDEAGDEIGRALGENGEGRGLFGHPRPLV